MRKRRRRERRWGKERRSMFGLKENVEGKYWESYGIIFFWAVESVCVFL